MTQFSKRDEFMENTNKKIDLMMPYIKKNHEACGSQCSPESNLILAEKQFL